MRSWIARCCAAALVLAVAVPALLAAEPPRGGSAARTVVAYYFHGAQRCRTCLHIESTAERVLRDRFDPELKAGELAWRTVNFDRPGNEHFIKDFQLVASSLVLVELEGEKPVRHKVLEKVWQFARDEAEFEAYVARETASFLKVARG